MAYPNMKLLIVLIWITGFAFYPVGSTNADPIIRTSRPLAILIEEGLANNKEIQSMEDQVTGLKEEISFAGSLNDPRIGFTLANIPIDTLRFDQEPMTQKKFFIAQKIPWFGKLDLKSRRAAVKATRQEAKLAAKRLSLSKQIAMTYYELGSVASSRKINTRLAKLVSQLLRVSETRYATGRGLQQDVLHAQVELSKLLDEKIMLDKKGRVLEDRINELLNRNQFSPIDPPEDLQDPDMILKVQDLNDRAMKHNPQLHVRRADVYQAAIDVELAQKDYLPDMDFKLAYGQRDTSRKGADWTDFFSASVVMNVPLWHKTRQDKKLSANRARRQAVSKAYEYLATGLPHRIDALVNEITSTQENYRLLRNVLIVQASQWAQSSLTAYEVGKLEFNSMINAQMRLLRIELAADRHLFSIYKKRAELEEIIGSPLPEQNIAEGENNS